MDPTIQPEGEAPTLRRQGTYLIRVTLTGNGQTEPPKLEEMEAIVLQPLAELGWVVGVKAERVDE